MALPDELAVILSGVRFGLANGLWNNTDEGRDVALRFGEVFDEAFPVGLDERKDMPLWGEDRESGRRYPNRAELVRGGDDGTGPEGNKEA